MAHGNNAYYPAGTHKHKLGQGDSVIGSFYLLFILKSFNTYSPAYCTPQTKTPKEKLCGGKGQGLLGGHGVHQLCLTMGVCTTSIRKK